MSEEYLKNAQDLTKSQKHESINHSLSNMDARDASASKKAVIKSLLKRFYFFFKNFHHNDDGFTQPVDWDAIDRHGKLRDG